jgi:hypothetical protein
VKRLGLAVRVDRVHNSIPFPVPSAGEAAGPDDPYFAFSGASSLPFVEPLSVRLLGSVTDEPERRDAEECDACRTSDDEYVWVAERWRVRATRRPTGLPVVLALESRPHLDLGDLTNLLAAELGVMTVRLEKAIRSLPGVAQVHVHRWGDGDSHLRVWFLARPAGHLELRGPYLGVWDRALPAVPESEWRNRLGTVAAWLADFGGRAVADPPRLSWQELPPLSIGDLPTAADGSTTGTADSARPDGSPAGDAAAGDATSGHVTADSE